MKSCRKGIRPPFRVRTEKLAGEKAGVSAGDTLAGKGFFLGQLETPEPPKGEGRSRSASVPLKRPAVVLFANSMGREEGGGVGSIPS